MTPKIRGLEIMETCKVLPDHVLREQVCQQCFHYLSIPPIVLNRQGERICGRCVNPTRLEDHTESLFNTIATRFQFKCTNHLNGCQQILSFAKMKSHEETCIYGSQDCFLCSYSGNLSQVVNHSIKLHSENISFNGIIPFLLPVESFKKTLLCISRDHDIFLLEIELTEYLFKLVIKVVVKNSLSSINQYAVKFFKPNDTSFVQIHSDYGLLSTQFENTFQKPIEQLVSIFGPGTKLHCQFLVDSFTSEEKELELHRRIISLRRSEQDLHNSKQELTLQRTEFSHHRKKYHAAMEIIKKMSFNLFKCSKCQKNSFSETYFCPKVHCYCKNCLSSFCMLCNTVREFKRLYDIENFSVSCDWCKHNICIGNYLTHRFSCSGRPYKCPLENCYKVIYSAESLQEHWHSQIPALIGNKEILCEKYECVEYYWLLNNDLFHVLVKFDEDNVQVLIEDITVLQNGRQFSTRAFSGKKWTKLSMSTFYDKYRVDMKNDITPVSAKQIYVESGPISKIESNGRSSKNTYAYSVPKSNIFSTMDEYLNREHAYMDKSVPVAVKYTKLKLSSEI